MDPISFAASLITVVATVGTVAKHLEELRSALQHAPDVLSSLVNEVADLRVVLDACEDAGNDSCLGSGMTGPPDAARFLEQTREYLQELDGIVRGCLNGKSSAHGVLRSTRLRWVKARGRAEKVQQKLRESKLDLVMLMESQSV